MNAIVWAWRAGAVYLIVMSSCAAGAVKLSGDMGAPAWASVILFIVGLCGGYFFVTDARDYWRKQP